MGSPADDARGEIARMAQDLEAVVEQFGDLKGLLERTLPVLGEPDSGQAFHDAAEVLTDELDEMAVHQLSMLLSELWLYRNGAAPRAPLPVDGRAAGGALTGDERSMLPAILEVAVNLAGYLGSAAIGGVVGNRTDARVRRIVQGVHERWRARRGGPHDPLTRDEAVEVAVAAVAAEGYEDCEVLGAVPRADSGSWVVRMSAGAETLTVAVPPGDPSRARVVIRIS
ncbi:hypothetical protein GCM10023085_62900 [Actinomadura viridis]